MSQLPCFIFYSVAETGFRKVGLGNEQKKKKNQYFWADLRYTIHISVFCIWIKQINKVIVTM